MRFPNRSKMFTGIYTKYKHLTKLQLFILLQDLCPIAHQPFLIDATKRNLASPQDVIYPTIHRKRKKIGWQKFIPEGKGWSIWGSRALKFPRSNSCCLKEYK